MKTARFTHFTLVALIVAICLSLSSCGTTRGHIEHDFGYDWNSGQYYTPGPGHNNYYGNKKHKAPKPPKPPKHNEKHGKKPKPPKHDKHDKHDPHHNYKGPRYSYNTNPR